MDDILIHAPSYALGLERLRAVLQRLREAQFYCKIEKCAFMRTELKFLGHVMSADGLKVDPDKVAVVQAWPVPTNVSGVRSYLGMGNFLRKFIQGWSALTAPLNAVLKKDAPFVWSRTCLPDRL